MRVTFAPTKLGGDRRRGLQVPVARTSAWQGAQMACVPIALLKGRAFAQGAVFTDRFNSKLVAEGMALHRAHCPTSSTTMDPENAAQRVSGVQHLKTFMAVVAAPGGTTLPPGFEERVASFGHTGAADSAAVAELAVAELENQPGFLTFTHMGHTMPFLLERSGNGGGNGGGSGGTGGPTTGYLCNDLGSYLHPPDSEAARAAHHGYVVRVQPSAGCTFWQQLKAVLGSQYSLRYKDIMPNTPTLDEAVQYLAMQIDVFAVAPTGVYAVFFKGGGIPGRGTHS